MTNFELFDYTQTWLLIKYSKFVNGSNNVTSYQSSSRMHGDNWKTVESSDFGSPLIACLTPTNYLMIKQNDEIYVKYRIEFVNLCACKANLKGVYKGNSLLIMHKMKDFLRKFRIQFAQTKFKSGEENCQSFVKTLSKSFQILDYSGSSEASETTRPSQDLKSQFLMHPRFTTGNERKTAQGTEQRMDLKMLTQTILDKNESKLPLLYQETSESEFMDEEGSSVLKEFVTSCLLDPHFPAFVKKIELLVAQVINDEK